MRKSQKVYFKIIVIGDMILVFLQLLWDFSRHKTYWFRADIQHYTLWQEILDMFYKWWYGLPREVVFMSGFLLAGIVFFTLSIIMED